MTNQSIKSSSMIYVDKILEVYTSDDDQRKAHIFQKVDANDIIHYGCRYYERGVFMFDEFYPGKSLSWTESAALNWTIGVKNS